jgi:hypothetical protein
MILTDNTAEWRRRRERFERAHDPERQGAQVREDSPMLVVGYWPVPKRSMDSAEWNEALQEQLPIKQTQEAVGDAVAKACSA